VSAVAVKHEIRRERSPSLSSRPAASPRCKTTLTAPQAAPPGKPVLVEAKVERAEVAYRPRRQLIVHADGVVLRFFNFYGSQLKRFQRAAEEGLRVRAFGEVRGGWFGAEMAHPRYRFVREAKRCRRPDADLSDDRRARARGAARADPRALDAGPLEDTLPEPLRSRYAWPVQRQRAASAQAAACRRYGSGMAAREIRRAPRAAAVDALCVPEAPLPPGARIEDKRRAPQVLPQEAAFTLTRAQARAMNEVLRDVSEQHPMQRLLQGDVGSGKTVVAAIACLAAADAGWQAAVMAPTEILSERISASLANGSLLSAEDRLVAWGIDEKAESRGSRLKSSLGLMPWCRKASSSPSWPRRGR